MVAIHVLPSTAIVDEVIRILVTGLLPDQKITVVAHIVEDNRGWASCGHFQATNKGEVNLSEHHCFGGSYKGLMPMGLFCSLKVLPGEQEGIRLHKKDTSEPLRYKLLVYDGLIEAAEVLQSGVTPLTEKSLRRWYRREGVTVEIIRSGAVRGILYLPPGCGPFPGIIDLYGIGGIFECRSALLASHGFATLCLPYSFYEDLPNISPIQINLEYFEEAIEVFCNHPKVMSYGIGVIGTSFGGEAGLSMASYLPNKHKIKAVVAVGAMVAHSGMLLYRGETFPMCSYDAVVTDEGIIFGQNTVILPESFIQLKETTANLLFLCGGDDKSVGVEKHLASLTEYMEKHSKMNYEVLVYPGAGHVIDPPYMPVANKTWIDSTKVMSLFGGAIVEHSFAQEDSWKKVLSFFNENVSGNHSSLTTSKM